MSQRLGPALALLFIVSTATIFTPRQVLAAPPAKIAAAINGNIVLFQADGSWQQVLTHDGIDGSPMMSPDGKMVAFLRWPGGLNVFPRRHSVILAAPAHDGRYSITTISTGSPLTTPQRATLAWQPGMHPPGIAWFDAGNIALRQLHQGAHRALRVGPSSSLAGNSRIAFSPDGQEIATSTGPGRSNGYPTTLHVVIGNPARGTQRTITIRFRPGVLSAGTIPTRGSFPVGDGLAFADNHHLLLGTIGKGEGYQLTGVFMVPDTGGTAHLILGNGHGVHNRPPYAPALAGATRFQLSPNRKYLATDPDNHLWISGDVAAPHAISIPLGRSCVLSEWTWLADSSGLAYVTACTIPGSSPLRYRLTLATVSRTGGVPHTLYTLRSTSQSAIDLAPSYRCVACGG